MWGLVRSVTDPVDDPPGDPSPAGGSPADPRAWLTDGRASMMRPPLPPWPSTRTIPWCCCTASSPAAWTRSRHASQRWTPLPLHGQYPTLQLLRPCFQGQVGRRQRSRDVRQVGEQDEAFGQGGVSDLQGLRPGRQAIERWRSPALGGVHDHRLGRVDQGGEGGGAQPLLIEQMAE